MPSHLKSFIHQRDAFLRGDDSPTAFLRRCLEIVDRREPTINAFVVIDREGAIAAAAASTARWAAGQALSPIDGMPIGIKDVIETANMPTGQGAARFAGDMTGRDAASVFALREAGAIVFGKTVTTEFAATHPGPTRNPWDLERTPGGSSSGSAAAVAAGMVPAALGTQVVGSVIRPASYCGVYGYKPTFGALNRGGCNDQLSQSCIGVLGASFEDIQAVAHVIAEGVGGDPGHPGLDLTPATRTVPKTLAVLELPGYAGADPAARDAFARLCDTLRAAGLKLVDRRGNAGLEQLEQAVLQAFDETRRIVTWETLWPMREYAASADPRLSQAMQGRVQDGRAMTVADYRSALARRQQVRALAAEVLGAFDATISLAATGAAPMGLASTGNPAQNVAASYLGWPVVTLPVMGVVGLPLGLQVMGKYAKDAPLIGYATHLEGLLTK